ncbi:hypothetical protein SLA2020_367110 [Shorea laevis]
MHFASTGSENAGTTISFANEIPQLDMKNTWRPKICYSRTLSKEARDSIVSTCLFTNLQYEAIGEPEMEEGSEVEIKILKEEDESVASI